MSVHWEANSKMNDAWGADEGKDDLHTQRRKRMKRVTSDDGGQAMCCVLRYRGSDAASN